MPWAGSLQVKAFWVRKGLIGGERESGTKLAVQRGLQQVIRVRC